MIVNLVDHSAKIVIPEHKKIFSGSKSKVRPADLYRLYAIVRVEDIDNACPEWLNQPGMEGATCRNLGPAHGNDREAVKCDPSCYRETCRLWIDRKLRFLIKRETPWNRIELRNIVE